ncbi:MAG TPA: metal-dependent hydrolase [Victivallales bacterium]|nr:metal-dependent hydrolase [Victivallales bacterium]
MANYKQHLTGGIIYGILCMLMAIFSLGFTIVNGFTIFVLGTLGSILPDIDSDTSIPVQLLFETIGILIPIIVLKNYFSKELNIENMIFLIVIGYILVRYGISLIFYRLTVHRGIIHSIPAAVIAGGIVFFLFYDSQFYIRLIYALSCTGGFIVHLLMDEIWSVDLANIRIKNSFGTALSLRSNSIISTVTAYLLIALIVGYILTNVQIPDKFNTKQDKPAIVLLDEKTPDSLNIANEFLLDVNSTWVTLYKKYFTNQT